MAGAAHPKGMLTAVLDLPSNASAPADEDRALVASASAGSTAAFESLYRRHAGRVHGVICRLVGGQGTRAEDLTQETFVRAWQALRDFRNESAFGTWLQRLAVNTTLMDMRARRVRRHDEGDEDGLEFVGQQDSAGARTALRMDLEKAVASLPPRARAVLVLYDIEGWRHEEIAEELGMAVGSSKAQLHRARTLLRERLGDPA